MWLCMCRSRVLACLHVHCYPEYRACWHCLGRDLACAPQTRDFIETITEVDVFCLRLPFQERHWRLFAKCWHNTIKSLFSGDDYHDKTHQCLVLSLRDAAFMQTKNHLSRVFNLAQRRSSRQPRSARRVPDQSHISIATGVT